MKVGDYVRTKNGNIFKIVGGNCDNWEIDIDYSKLEQTEENWLELYRYNDNYSFFNDTNIIKSSPNIIDLIEVGDYVNGMQVTRFCFDEDGKRILNLSNCILELMNEDIKSIITKEQFESVEYKVVD